MSRSDLKYRMDDAVRQSRITLLHGLPRVGRTKIARSWASDRGDVAVRPFKNGDFPDAPVVLHDHLDFSDVPTFVAQFRTLDETSDGTRFVIVPHDLRATRALQRSLTGWVRTIEVPPLQPDEYLGAQLKTEVAANPVLGASAEPTPTNSVIVDPHQHWLRGGIPESLQAESAAASLVWRRNMIDDLLARDYRDFDVPAASRLRDLLLWIANQNCGEFDEDGFSLMKRAEMRSALYVLEQIGIVRRLSNFPADSNLSFAKKPKLYIRDSGILHATLGIETVDQLRARRDIGSSWEGYATEALIEASQGRATYQFYRAEGEEGEDEIDLVLAFTSASVIAGIEFKTSPAAKPRPGFFRACSAIDARERFVVHSGDVAQSDEGIPRLDLLTAIGRVRGLAQS